MVRDFYLFRAILDRLGIAGRLPGCLLGLDEDGVLLGGRLVLTVSGSRFIRDV